MRPPERLDATAAAMAARLRQTQRVQSPQSYAARERESHLYQQ